MKFGGISQALSKKYGPLPGYAWAGLIALGLYFVAPHLFGKGAAAAGQPGATQATPGTSDYAAGYTQGYASGASGSRGAPGGSPPGPRPITTDPGGATGQGVRDPVNPSPGTGSRPPGPGGSVPPSDGNPGLPYDPVYSPRQPVAPSPGQGGPSIGSRSADPWEDHSQLHKRRVIYPHYVLARGGPAAHHSEVHRVARSAGLHPARLLALNPHHTGLIRVA